MTRGCPHTGNTAITQNQPTLPVNTQQTSSIGPTLFPATNPKLLKTITVETPDTSEVWKTLMEQVNKVNQDNKLLKKAYKKVKQNQAYSTKAKSSSPDTNSKANKTGQNQTGRHKVDT